MTHLLRRIELTGFKSFASRTVIDLPAGITGIVGPNGSGKSNVVDAVRWLLGERDAKHLRGGTVDDLIFAGTPNRARVGQATASFTFDNSRGMLPVDAPEVVLSRQVSRDGTSRYFINKQEVLLRDLIDVMARARLGARGLTVVSQGNSDVFVQASPAKRREMVEELLGLREFQLKKRDAERRLRGAETNLAQAHALVAELEPQLRVLRRQVSRFQRRDEIAAELSSAEDELYGSQLSAAQRDLSAIAAETDSLQAQRPALDRAREQAAAARQDVENRAPTEGAELAAVKQQLMSAMSAQSDTQKLVGRLEARLEMLQARAEEPEAPETAALVSLLRSTEAELNALLEVQDLATFTTRIRAIAERIRNAFSRPGAREPHPDEAGIVSELAAHRAALQESAEGVQKLRARSEELEAGQAGFYDAFRAASDALDAANRALENWRIRLQQLESRKERANLMQGSVLQALEHAGRAPESLPRVEHVLAHDDLTRLERQVFRLRGELAAIGDVDDQMIEDARATEERYQQLVAESADLESARADLLELVADLDRRITREFSDAIATISDEFAKLFAAMFGGGTARLVPVSSRATTVNEEGEEEAGDATGIEIEVQLPKKRASSLEVLSGGERSLVGLAALFALVSVSPPPFLVLDEVDAPLDERNARRFGELLRSFAHETQFIIVTHNRATMEAADVLYGVTLEADGSSKVVSLKIS